VAATINLFIKCLYIPYFFYAITFVIEAAMIFVAYKLYLKVVSKETGLKRGGEKLPVIHWEEAEAWLW